MPKVSVIIPNYNHDKYLRQRIDSVLGQTYADFETIILDDCSSDTSRSIINGYASHPLVSKIVFNDKNSGSPFKQWQRGIGLAQGEWIWLAESDDYADERFLELLMAGLANRENVGIVYCDSKIVIDDHVLTETFADIKNKKYSTQRWSESYVNSGMDEIENYLLAGGTINNTSAVLYNKKILMKADAFDIPFRYIGDKYATVKVLANADIVYVKDALNYFRDPFNRKHVDRWIYYFYEHFLIFDWVYKNLHEVSQEKFNEAFYENTGNSLFRNWNKRKLTLYIDLFRRNPRLLVKSVNFNFWRAFRSRMSPPDRIS